MFFFLFLPIWFCSWCSSTQSEVNSIHSLALPSYPLLSLTRRESSQLLIFNQAHLSLGSFHGLRRALCQHTLQQRTALKPERGPDPQPGLTYVRIPRECLVIFLGIPKQEVSQKWRGVTSCGCFPAWSSCRLRAPPRGSDPFDGTQQSALFVKIQFVGILLSDYFSTFYQPDLKEPKK